MVGSLVRMFIQEPVCDLYLNKGTSEVSKMTAHLESSTREINHGGKNSQKTLSKSENSYIFLNTLFSVFIFIFLLLFSLFFLFSS